MRILHRLSLFTLLCFPGFTAFGQSQPGINSVITKIGNQYERLPVEKLYLQLGKANYVQNDTLWFKAYLLNADLSASTRSGLLYVELDDNDNIAVKRMMLPLAAGVSWGDIALGEAIPDGNYTLRAYTNWMRNFGEGYIFKKGITIAAAGAQSRLITAGFKSALQQGKQNIQGSLLITGLNKNPIRLQDMQVKVTDAQQTLLKDKTATGVDGVLNINFNLPPGTVPKNLGISIHDIAKGVRNPTDYTIPVILNRPEDIDLQFMPEGGALVAGIQAKVGFKAIGEDGKGLDVSGTIYDSKQQEISTFQSAHNGMGSFELTPVAGESYTAKLSAPGSAKGYALPAINPSGVCLRLISYRQGDSLRAIISVTPDLLAAGKNIFNMIGQAGGAICYAASYSFKNTTGVFMIPKGAFPDGIAHFTLFNNANMPVAERVVYVNHHNTLQVKVGADKMRYAPHDSVGLNINVTDKTGKPVRGSFSMAVTDDSQVKTDSLGSNILNAMLLTSDLKGTVEQPGYYFETDSLQRLMELDNLLLTQGWVGYDWKQVFGPETKPEFAAEPEFSIQGTVTNIFNKPVANSPVTILSKKPLFVADTVTDKNGRFVFKGFLPVDTASFLLQARNKHNKSVNVGINVDEFKAPVFAPDTRQFSTPWYVNSDTLVLHNVTDRVIMQQQEDKLNGIGHMLKTVTIKNKKIIKNSKNLNGPGESDQALDEQDMLKAGKLTLADLLAQKIKGFHVGFIPFTPIMVYFINDEITKFTIDGVYLDKLYSPTGSSDSYYQFVKQYLDYFTAEDITGIEVMYNPEYSSNYISTHISPLAAFDIKHPIAFIEVTTRSGHGPFMKKEVGTYLYKPLPATLPQKFYRPKYTVKTVSILPDLRSTIHWEPNIITDTAGNAKVSFYSADKPGTYTIILEGVDLNGGIGFERRKIVVK